MLTERRSFTFRQDALWAFLTAPLLVSAGTNHNAGADMGPSDQLCLMLWVSAVFTSGLGCPELCKCANKYGRHCVECYYQDLTEVPPGLPPNVSTVSLSTNKIKSIPMGIFDNITQVTSLWLANNEIVSIEPGALAPLVLLRNFDISYNMVVDFPWEDLENLTALQLLKMNHNRMVLLPGNAFSNLKDLKSLRLNNNKFITIVEGTFDGLESLSYLQIYNNPFACTCALDWFRDWISTTTVSVPEQNWIICESPEKLKGEIIGVLPESKCTFTNVTIRTEPNSPKPILDEGSELVLTCEFTGNPKPLVSWSIHSKSHKQKLALSFTEDDSAESNEVSLPSHNRVKVFTNGTLMISHIRTDDGGNYSCSATNEFGRSEDSVLVTVLALPKAPPGKTMTLTETQTSVLPTGKTSVLDSEHDPNAKTNPGSFVEETVTPSHSSKCGLSAKTTYISSYAFNRSMDDVKQYTFDFGLIALGVSETEAAVRLNPRLIPRDRTSDQAASENLHGDSEKRHRLHSNGLYLCIPVDRKHSAVQWSRLKEGVNTYLFSSLHPGTNYSLCITYRGKDCEVQLLFTTRRREANLLIIIAVSICLLTVSTVPLLGAACFHLVYKYRSKTYKLILKAKDQYHMERNLAVHLNMHAPDTGSQRKLEEEETESGDGQKEADTEESILTESFSLSQCRGNLENCEVGSEYSDRLPLGAEAMNIITNYNYPNL